MLCGWTAKYNELNEWHRAGTERESDFQVFPTIKNREHSVVMKLLFREDPSHDQVGSRQAEGLLLPVGTQDQLQSRL